MSQRRTGFYVVSTNNVKRREGQTPFFSSESTGSCKFFELRAHHHLQDAWGKKGYPSGWLVLYMRLHFGFTITEAHLKTKTERSGKKWHICGVYLSERFYIFGSRFLWVILIAH